MESLSEIWQKYSLNLASFIRSKVESDIVDDLLQNVFVKVHKQLDSLNDESRLESWLYQITRNVIIDHYRSRQQTVELSVDQLQDTDSVEPSVQEEFSKWMLPMIDRLPDKYRKVITLSDIERRTQQEVADELGLSLSAVKSRVRRAREMLKGVFFECCQIEFNQHNQIVDYKNIDGTCDDS